MCTVICSSAHLSEFGIEEGYLILDLPKNPFWLLYLKEEGGQNIVTVWVDQGGGKKKRYTSLVIFSSAHLSEFVIEESWKEG